MSITEPTLLSLTRAAVISLASLAVLLLGGPAVRAMPRTVRRLVFWIAMSALLAPGFASAFLLLKVESLFPKRRLPARRREPFPSS